MSAVISSAKKVYLQALIYESVFFVVISLGLVGVKWQIALSFGAGSLVALLPFGLFVYWFFFRHREERHSHKDKMRAFYYGEMLKWLLTIVLMILSFRFIPTLSILFFFVGYFIGLITNIMTPMWLNRAATT